MHQVQAKVQGEGVTTRIHVGDCRDVLKGMPDGWYHTVCTSPPYWGLRSYLDPDDPDKALELGSEETPDLYVAHMVEVFREVWRVLRPDGVCWLNLGDSFASGKGTCYNPGGGSSSLGKERKAAGAHPLNRGNKSTLAQSGLKPKDLCMIPARVALALQADGWWLRSDIIWHKPNCMPESVTDRPTKSHEYMFLLTKSARYYFDADAVRETQHGDGRKRGCVHSKERSNGTGRNDGGQEWQDNGGRNIRTVWTIPTRSFKGAHFATFPPALVTPCIKAGSSQRGCCPECGAGWERVTEREQQLRPRPTGTERERNRGGRTDGFTKMPDGLAGVSVTTTGWAPTCECYRPAYERLGYTPDTQGFTFPDGTECTRAEALSLLSLYCADFLPPVPCRTLDPFGGAGTVALVARQLGRDCDLIELNASYAEMAQQRLDATPVHTVETDAGEVEVQQMAMFSQVSVR